MAQKVTISVDALGGDNAPGVVLEGVAQALEQDIDLSVILCGPAEIVEPFAEKHDRCTARATTEVISMAEHPISLAALARRSMDSTLENRFRSSGTSMIWLMVERTTRLSTSMARATAVSLCRTGPQ